SAARAAADTAGAAAALGHQTGHAAARAEAAPVVRPDGGGIAGCALAVGHLIAGERPRDRVRERAGLAGADARAAGAADAGELGDDRAQALGAVHLAGEPEAERAEPPDRLGQPGQVGAGLAGVHE